MEVKLARWLIGFVALAYAATVLSTAFYNFRTLLLAGQDPDFLRMLRWQAVTYAVWIPVGAWSWGMFRREGLVPKAALKFAVLCLVLIPAHVVVTTLFETRLAAPGAIDLKSLAAQRAHLDVLTFASFSILAVAAHFQRKAAEEAGGAALVRRALDAAQQALATARPADDRPSPLMVSVGARRVIVPYEEVEWFASAGNYVVVNWDHREGLIRDTLQAIERRVNATVFARVHRTSIVNLSRVREAEPLSDRSWRLTMASGAEILVGRTYRDAILARLAGEKM